jgi:predicted aspartyl protease
MVLTQAHLVLPQ